MCIAFHTNVHYAKNYYLSYSSSTLKMVNKQGRAFQLLSPQEFLNIFEHCYKHVVMHVLFSNSMLIFYPFPLFLSLRFCLKTFLTHPKCISEVGISAFPALSLKIMLFGQEMNASILNITTCSMWPKYSKLLDRIKISSQYVLPAV